MNTLKVARKVLSLERQALVELSDSLDESFVSAVQAMSEVEGRVIVSGMGKSGHIGRKIAATFASTGTPAQYVHPAEASHGDLGMITSKDLVLMISHSGETAELSSIITHTTRFNVPLIAITAKIKSTLEQAADIAIIFPKVKEACPMGLAPTSSTTATLALGDALAVALMELRGFTPDNFRVFHPGGTLGARLVSARHLIHGGSELPLVPVDASMPEAVAEMNDKGFGIVGLVDNDGRLVGVITDGDLRRNIDDILDKPAVAVASENPRVITDNDTAGTILALMQNHAITCLFAVDEEKRPLGVINIHDCLKLGAI